MAPWFAMGLVCLPLFIAFQKVIIWLHWSIFPSNPPRWLGILILIDCWMSVDRCVKRARFGSSNWQIMNNPSRLLKWPLPPIPRTMQGYIHFVFGGVKRKRCTEQLIDPQPVNGKTPYPKWIDRLTSILSENHFGAAYNKPGVEWSLGRVVIVLMTSVCSYISSSANYLPFTQRSDIEDEPHYRKPGA